MHSCPFAALNFAPINCSNDALAAIAAQSPLGGLSHATEHRNLKQYARASLAGIQRFVAKQSEHELLQFAAVMDGAVDCGYLVVAEPVGGATGADVAKYRHAACDACRSMAWLSDPTNVAIQKFEVPLGHAMRRFYIVGMRIKIYNGRDIVTVPFNKPRLETLAPGHRAELKAPVVRARTRRVVGATGGAQPRVTYWYADFLPAPLHAGSTVLRLNMTVHKIWNFERITLMKQYSF